VFQKAIQVNGEKQNANIVNLFYFTLRDVILEWGKKIMHSHQGYTFFGIGSY
jgi:hypothetical protein